MKIFISFLSLLIFLSSSFSQDEKDYSEAFSLIEIWLEAQKDFEQLPGITAIIIDDQKVLWSGGFGMANINNEVKANSSTLYSICSISKLFTSVAIMKLYDEGKLRLDDQVIDLLPWYNLEQIYPESGPVTIRTLLTHSSGLPREAAYPYWTGPDFSFPTSDQIKTKLGEQETLYPASTYFQYSNLALTLLGEIVREISGQAYDQYIQENILNPLDLSNTRTELPESMLGKNLAIGYSSINRDGKREKVNFFQAKGIQAAAGFSSNVEDLGRFASWQFRLLSTKETEILRSSTLDYMQRVHWTDPDWKTTRGLGFGVYKSSDGTTLVGHGGSCPGYRSSLTLDTKSKMAYVVMINASGTNPGKYIEGIRNIMKKVKPLNDKKENETVAENLKDYVGFYNQQPWWSEMYIGAWQGKLVSLDLPTYSPENSMKFFKYIEKDVFRRIRDDDTLGETLVFERDSIGKVFRVNSHGNYSVRIK
ncbi:MAG: serine hydrolase domain-containing protein [Bacteroidota bacterium]|nr:serine hydrolase domain-containing protein [Bacteroidota bacterium]